MEIITFAILVVGILIITVRFMQLEKKAKERFAWYNQAYDTLGDRITTYRVITPSRFGYTGSDVPENPSVENQVEAFVELLDSLEIEQPFNPYCTFISFEAGGHLMKGNGKVIEEELTKFVERTK